MALPAWAVYAPVPDQDQGKPLTFTAKTALSYDSNIFGGATGEIGSSILQFAPKVAYNASITDTTFMSLSYELTLDQYDKRPGEKLLDSHSLMARIARAFSPTTTIDIVEMFQAMSSPESLLNGLPLNADQSSKRNEIDGTFATSINAKLGVTAKIRTVYSKYRNAVLGRSLDHFENLYGVAASYAVRADLKAAGEFRHQDVYYDKLGETKNKNSDYLMGGLDYELAKQLTVSGRAGLEWRHRAAERSASLPYLEVTAKYDYTEDSFLTGGYMLTVEETSDLARFTDSRVNRFFISAQHHITALIVASGSFTYEPSVLRGRRGHANIDEDTTRAGIALSYLPTKNWTTSASYDYDDVQSGDAARTTKRTRFGLNASYTF
jgi:hypothetical protein